MDMHLAARFAANDNYVERVRCLSVSDAPLTRGSGWLHTSAHTLTNHATPAAAVDLPKQEVLPASSVDVLMQSKIIFFTALSNFNYIFKIY